MLFLHVLTFTSYVVEVLWISHHHHRLMMANVVCFLLMKRQAIIIQGIKSEQLDQQGFAS